MLSTVIVTGKRGQPDRQRVGCIGPTLHLLSKPATATADRHWSTTGGFVAVGQYLRLLSMALQFTPVRTRLSELIASVKTLQWIDVGANSTLGTTSTTTGVATLILFGTTNGTTTDSFLRTHHSFHDVETTIAWFFDEESTLGTVVGLVTLMELRAMTTGFGTSTRVRTGGKFSAASYRCFHHRFATSTH